MLPKANSTSNSRMSGSRWVIIPSWLSGSCSSFLYNSSVYSCRLFLIFLLCYHTISVLYCAHFCVKCSLSIYNFLEEPSSLSHSIVFLYFFALITKEGFLISPCYLWNSAFKWVCLSLSPLPLVSLFSAICKALSDNHFAISFSWVWSWSLPLEQCQEGTSVHSSSGTLSVRSNPLNLFVNSTV